MTSGSKPTGGSGESLPGIRPLTAEEHQWLMDNDPSYRHMVEFQEKMRQKYGVMEDSTDLIREDRENGWGRD